MVNEKSNGDADPWVTAAENKGNADPTAVIGFLLIGGCLALLAFRGDWLGIDWGFLNDRVTDYQVYCSGEMQGSECKGVWYQGSPTATYTVLKDQQLVISQISDESPRRLKDCAVIDRLNWRCKTDAPISIEIGYDHGEFFSGWEMQSVKHVSRMAWLDTAKDPNKKMTR